MITFSVETYKNYMGDIRVQLTTPDNRKHSLAYHEARTLLQELSLALSKVELGEDE